MWNIKETDLIEASYKHSRGRARLCGLQLTWITASIMLTILLTIAITLWVRSVGLTSGLYWLDNTYRHAMYNTYVGDNLKWTVELLV